MTLTQKYQRFPRCSLLLIFLLHSPSTFIVTECGNRPNLYTQSISDLDKIYYFELEFARKLLIWSKTQPLEIKDLRLYVEDVFEFFGAPVESGNLPTEIPRILYSPVCAFRSLWRIKYVLRRLLFNRSSTTLGALTRLAIIFFWKIGWPQLDDLELAVEKILSLQLIYNLTSKQISQGRFSFELKASSCNLNSAQCFKIGLQAKKSLRHTFAITWLELALKKALDDGLSNSLQIQYVLQDAIANHNEDFEVEPKEKLDHWFFNRMIRSYVPGDGGRAKTLRHIFYEKFKGRREKSHEKTNYFGLCAGENFQTDLEKSKLFCWYEFKNNPSLTISPAKMEFIGRDPEIVQIHDFLRETETGKFMLEHKKEMKLNLDQKGNNVKKIHHSQLSGNLLNFTSFLSEKMYIQTGLQIKRAKRNVEVESRTFGSYYFPRMDKRASFSKDMEQITTVTFFIFLNEVESGGEIVFPNSGISVKPSKGSAILWHHRFSDGTLDANAVHGACPVPLGDKWVAKTWLTMVDQFPMQKCSLTRKRMQKISVNDVHLKSTKYLENTRSISAVKISSLRQAHPNTTFQKYSYITPPGRTEFVKLEWKIYLEIKKLYQKYSRKLQGTFKMEFESLNKDVLMYLEYFEETTRNVLGDEYELQRENTKLAKKISLNPLAYYKALYRFENFLVSWISSKKFYSSRSQFKSSIKRFVDGIYNISTGPSKDDYSNSALAILKLTFVYELDIRDVVAGKIDGYDSKVTLSSEDCLVIGDAGIANKFFAAGIEWLEYGLFLLRNGSTDSYKMENIQEVLAEAEILHDEALKQKKKIPEYNFYQERLRISGLYKKVKKMSLQLKNPEFITSEIFHQYRFWQICSGKYDRNENERSKLFCYYEREVHPIYKIGPLKVEVYSFSPNPGVVLYHDILNERSIRSLKKILAEDSHALPLSSECCDPLNSEILRVRDVNMSYASSREANQLMERVTGYKMKIIADDLPLYFYAHTPGTARGGHYDDLTDVEKGGETIFNRLGFKVTAKKGALLYWYNTYESGRSDPLSQHGSCPIVFGEKWIIAKDISDTEQTHFKCSLDPETAPPVIVNGKPL